jgi:uncharacterized repeat protein (TIGR01451 family)/prepilin-type N-terminal cleavage/methylation domain-containing protein
MSTHRRHAVSLIELVVVIVVLGILAAIAAAGYGSVIAKSRQAAVIAAAHSFDSAYRGLLAYAGGDNDGYTQLERHAAADAVLSVSDMAAGRDGDVITFTGDGKFACLTLTEDPAAWSTVDACDGSGNSAPAPPGGVLVTAQVNALTVSWDGQGDATSYKATATPGSRTCTTSTTSCTITELTGGTAYQVTVKAIGPTGTSSASAAVTATPVVAVTSVNVTSELADHDDRDVSGSVSVGDEVTFAATVTNTGNVPLEEISVDDQGGPETFAVPADIVFASMSSTAATVSASPARCDSATAAPGASVTCYASRTVTQGDVDAGGVRHSVTVTVVGSTGARAQTNAAANVPVARHAGVDVSQSPTTFDDVNDNARADAGETVGWSVTLTNTGNVTLSGVTAGAGTPGCSTLAPGAVCRRDVTQTLTQEDLDAGAVTSTISASANSPVGSRAAATTSARPLVRHGGIDVTMSYTSNDVDGTGTVTPGDIVTYDIGVTNTGNVTVAGIAVTDSLAGSSAMCGTPSLSPGTAAACTAAYTVTTADLAAGAVVNTSNVTGVGAGAIPLSRPAAATVVVRPANDNVSHAHPLSAASTQTAYLGAATAEGSEPAVAATGKSVWYRYQNTTATGHVVDVSTNASSSVTVAWYTGSSYANFSARQQTAATSDLPMYVAANTSAWVQLSAASTHTSPVTVTFSRVTALHAAATACSAKTFTWNAGSGAVHGGMHSNGNLAVSGTGNTFTGGTTYVGSLSAGTNTTYSPAPVKTSAADMPLTFSIADYQPGGARAAAAGTEYRNAGTSKIDSSWLTTRGLLNGNIIQPGIYYSSNMIDFGVSNLQVAGGGGVTFVSTGQILVISSGSTLRPYEPNGLLVFSDWMKVSPLSSSSNCDSAAVQLNGGTWDGIVYVPRGELRLAGSSGTVYRGPMMAWTVYLGTSGVTVSS